MKNFLSIVDRNLGMRESFRMVDDILSRAVGGISLVVLSCEENDINLDFADVKTVMSHRGMALMGVGEFHGESAAIEAIKNAIESPLLDNMAIDGARGVLVHFYIHPDYPLSIISEAMDIIYEGADEEAEVVFGTTTNKEMEIDRVKVTIVATGFEEERTNESEESSSEPQTTPAANKPTVDPNLSFRKEILERMRVSGSDLSDDILDVPTFIRNSMD